VLLIALSGIAGKPRTLILSPKYVKFNHRNYSIRTTESNRATKHEELMIDPLATSSEDFVEYLRKEAMSHDAVSHQYLKLVSSGGFPHMHEVLFAFVDEYRHYGKRFTQYVGMLMEGDANGHQCDQEHKELLEHDLKAEEGVLEDDEKEILERVGLNVALLDGVPHRQLFQQMRENIYKLLNKDSFNRNTNNSPGMQFADDIANILQKGSFPARVAGIGLGIESMVPTIYTYLVRAIENFTPLEADEYAFLLLHIYVDEGHGATMEGIVQDLALTTKVRREMLSTTRAILDARVRLWDNLLLSVHDKERNFDNSLKQNARTLYVS